METALKKAAQRKAMAKAVAKVGAAEPPPEDAETGKRTRQQTTPMKFATPGSKTPDPKHLKPGTPMTTPQKQLFGAQLAKISRGYTRGKPHSQPTPAP